MDSQQTTHVLIVANRTSSTPRLLEVVRRRAEAGPCEFALLIPDVTDLRTADWTLETAQRLLQPAARGRVEGLLGGPEPFESVGRRWGAGTLTRSSSRRCPRACQSGCGATCRGAWSRWGCL